MQSVVASTVREITRLFLIALPALGRRPRTVEFYGYVLGALANVLGSRPVQSITTAELREHLGGLQQRRRVTLATLSCHIRAIKTFFPGLYRRTTLR